MTVPKPRVLWLSKGLGRGGAEMLLVELARALEHTVDVDVAYVLPHKDALVQEIRTAGAGVHCLGNGRRGSWVMPLRQLLRSGRYDVVHTHSPAVAAVARLLIGAEVPMVHTEHNMWGRYRPVTRWANAATIHRNDVVWPVSQGVAGSIRPWFTTGGRPRCEVMLHGIAPRVLPRGAQARSEARSRLGLEDDAYVVGTVGNLTPKKDHETMLRAFRSFSKDRPRARLVIVGAGPRESHLRKYAREQGVSERVLFTGVREDVPVLLTGFDLFAMSSQHEGLSIALIEALAAGLPVVATRVGGIPELVVDEVHGLLVSAGDDAGMSRALTQLADDPALYAAFSDAGASRAAEFGIQRAADTLAAEYAALADGHTASAKAAP